MGSNIPLPVNWRVFSSYPPKKFPIRSQRYGGPVSGNESSPTEANTTFIRHHNPTSSGGGVGDSGEDFEEGCFSGAVSSDDSDDLSGLDLKGDIFEGPEEVFSVGGFAECFQSVEGGSDGVGDGFAKAFFRGFTMPDFVLFSEMFDANCGWAHGLTLFAFGVVRGCDGVRRRTEWTS